MCIKLTESMYDNHANEDVCDFKRGVCHKPVTHTILFVDFLSTVCFIFLFGTPLEIQMPRSCMASVKGQWCPVSKSLGRTCGCPVGQKALGQDKGTSVSRGKGQL